MAKGRGRDAKAALRGRHELGWNIHGAVVGYLGWLLIALATVFVIVSVAGWVSYNRIKTRYEDETRHVVDALVAQLQARITDYEEGRISVLEAPPSLKVEPGTKTDGIVLRTFEKDLVKLVQDTVWNEQEQKGTFTGYFYLFDAKLVCLANGGYPKLAEKPYCGQIDNETRITSLKDLARLAEDNTRNHRRGVLEYQWTKPGHGDENFKKIGYSRMLVEPRERKEYYDEWWVGSAVYVDDLWWYQATPLAVLCVLFGLCGAVAFIFHLRQRRFFLQFGQALILTDGNNHVVDANQHACEILGYSAEELKRLGVESLIPDGARRAFHDEMQMLDAGQRMVRYDAPRIRKNQDIIYLDVMVMHESENKRVHVIRDVTQERQLAWAAYTSSKRQGVLDTERVLLCVRLGNFKALAQRVATSEAAALHAEYRERVESVVRKFGGVRIELPPGSQYSSGTTICFVFDAPGDVRAATEAGLEALRALTSWGQGLDLAEAPRFQLLLRTCYVAIVEKTLTQPVPLACGEHLAETTQWVEQCPFNRLVTSRTVFKTAFPDQNGAESTPCSFQGEHFFQLMVAPLRLTTPPSRGEAQLYWELAIANALDLGPSPTVDAEPERDAAESSTLPFRARRFRVAISYARERSDVVGVVAERLARRFGEKQLLFDRFHEAEFSRPDLDTHICPLYRDNSELVVVFLSPEYPEKAWLRTEFRQVREMITSSDAHRVMLLSFGALEASMLKALNLTVQDGYLDITDRDPERICQSIEERVDANRQEELGRRGQPKGDPPSLQADD